MSIFILRSVFVYTRCAERTLIRIKQACCVTEFHFGKGLFYKQTHALAVLLKRKYCLRFVYGRKYLLSIANSTSRCSAQNLAHLGSKATNRRRDSFPSGHDQRSRCQIFLNVHCLPASTLLVVYKKNFAIFCFQLASRLVSFLPNDPVGVAAL